MTVSQLNGTRIIYNDMIHKVCSLQYTGGSIDRSHTLIHTQPWHLQELFDNLKHDIVLCMSMGDNGLEYEEQFVIKRWFEQPIIKFNTLPKFILHLFCTHGNVNTTNITSVPAGLMNSTQSNVHFLEEVAKNTVDKTNLLLLKFANTHPERPNLINHFLETDWATVEKPNVQIDKQYFEKIQQHKFVLCPRGHGPDSYRVWESLYLGSIPIVTEPCFTRYKLPILNVKNFYYLTVDYLERIWDSFQNKEWNYQELTQEYWLQRIKETHGLLIH